MPVAVLIRVMLVAQLSADGHGYHVPLLAGVVDRPYRRDFIPTGPNSLSQEPRMVGVF